MGTSVTGLACATLGSGLYGAPEGALRCSVYTRAHSKRTTELELW